MSKVKFLLSFALLMAVCAISLPTQLFSDQGRDVACSGLSANERQFAEQLTPANRMMFCRQFSPDQRAAAMQLMNSSGSSGQTALSADEAVENIAQNNNMMSPMSQQEKGSCPIQ